MYITTIKVWYVVHYRSKSEQYNKITQHVNFSTNNYVIGHVWFMADVLIKYQVDLGQQPV